MAAHRLIARAAVVALAAAAAPVAAQSVAQPSARVVSYAAPALAGDSLRLGRGEPPALVAVFATWCRECRAELAALDTLRRRWVAERRVAVPVAHDSVGAVLRTLGVVTVPTAFVVGGDGRVRWQGRGALRTTAPGLAAALQGVAARGAAR